MVSAAKKCMVEEKKIADRFAEYFKKWMDANISKWGEKTKLANEIGISTGHLANIVSKERGTTEDKRRLIATVINVPYEVMIGIKSDASDYISEEPSDYKPKTKTDILIEKTRTILESKTHWSGTLASNIESFHKGLQNDKLQKSDKG